MRRLGTTLILLIGILAVPSVAGAGRTLPCIEHELVDGRCEAWNATYDGEGAEEGLYDMAVSPDGRAIYAVGHTTRAEGIRALALAYDAATGEQRWAAAAGRPGDEYDLFASVAVAPDGRDVFAAGAACELITDGSTCDVLLSAFDAATGATTWSVVWDGVGRGLDSAQAVVATDEVIYIGGQTFSFETGVDYLVAAFDAASGEELWTSRYDGPRSGFDRGAALVLDGDVLVLTGKSTGSLDDDDIATVAFDTREDREGDIRWVARFDGGTGNDEAFSVAAGGGRVVVAGESATPVGLGGPLALGYDAATGEELWVGRYNDAGVGGGTFFDAAVTSDGARAVVTGYSMRSDGKGPSTLAFDAATGQRLWAADLQEGLATAVGTSSDGRRVYITGTSYTQRGTMHRTVSYSMETGLQRWEGLYEETAPPEGIRSSLILPSTMAVSPDGTHVYVGGTTRGWFATHDDAVVLAYQA